mgnify:FL=1
MFEAYLITLTGVVLAQAAPGPNLLAVASAGLGQGRKTALMTVMGVATGMMIWAVAVAFGLAAVLTIYPKLLTAMKIAGGAYLLWLAVRALLSAWRGGSAGIRAQRAILSAGAAWR